MLLPSPHQQLYAHLKEATTQLLEVRTPALPRRVSSWGFSAFCPLHKPLKVKLSPTATSNYKRFPIFTNCLFQSTLVNRREHLNCQVQEITPKGAEEAVGSHGLAQGPFLSLADFTIVSVTFSPFALLDHL